VKRTLTYRADIVVTSLGGDEAVEEVYKDLFGGQEVCPSYELGSLFIRDLLDVFQVLEDVADPQDQGGKGDGIVPGGRGRSTIFVDTSTVSLAPIVSVFHLLLSLTFFMVMRARSEACAQLLIFGQVNEGY
jgi:hypothetical protein